MRILVRLLIVAALAHAGFRAAQATLTYYTVRDHAEEVARSAMPQDTDADLVYRVVLGAQAEGVPLEAADVAIQRTGDHLTIDVRYTAPVELLPRYVHLWQFHFMVDDSAGPLTRTIAPLHR